MRAKVRLREGWEGWGAKGNECEGGWVNGGSVVDGFYVRGAWAECLWL